jgi:hypothetical protein
MTTSEQLIKLERQGCEALSDSFEATQDFYETVLHDAVRMLLPGGMLLEDKETVLKSFDTQPWQSFEIMNRK